MSFIDKYDYGNWRIESELGRGSYGQVYKIFREEHGFKSFAALKVIPVPQSSSEISQLKSDGLAGDSLRSYISEMVGDILREVRFVQEFKGVSNIVSYEDHKVIENEDDPGCVILIRMELLESLEALLMSRKFGESDAIQIGIDICQALELLGKNGVVHRDVKPGNILFSKHGFYKLGDFGIARQIDRTTSTLSMKGTYNYMAPEVFKNHKYGTSVDLYSLGLVLYRIMNNSKMPFIPANTIALTLSIREKALKRRMNGDPLPAPALASPELSKVILKACAFDPRDRFKTASEMKKALEGCKNPVPIPEPKPVPPAPKPAPPELKPLPKTDPLPIKRDLSEPVSASGKSTDHSHGDWRGDSTSKDAKHARDVNRVPSSAAKKTLMASMVLAVLAIFAFLVLPRINSSTPNKSVDGSPTPTARSTDVLIPTATPTTANVLIPTATPTTANVLIPTAPTATPTTTSAKTDAPAVLQNLPRNETLYFGGQQWGAVNGWNPFGSNNNNALALAGGASARMVMFETLYMYNILDGKFTPLLADGQFVWNDARTEMTVKMNKNAKWSDGTPVTAEDVAYTWDTHVKYETSTGITNSVYIASIKAINASTVVLKAVLADNGQALNPLMLEDYVTRTYVVQKAWTQKLEARAGGDAQKLKYDVAEDVVYSGPYGPYYDDDQKVFLIRNDYYWGTSLWGSLPVPKYLAHTIYSSNAATQVAFAAGEIDVDQQFLANVQNLWEKQNLPISTYIDVPPYGICVTTPSAWYNLKSYGLDQVAIRKAIALAVDYESVIANAMTNQSPTFSQTPRSLMNPTDGEQAMYDHDAVKDLQWIGNDIEGAKSLLDEAGIVDGDGDGWREYNGQNLSYNAVCPSGWTDWQASMALVAEAGKNIGINIETYFQEWDVYQTVFPDGDQTEYDIFMYVGDSTGPTFPWARVRQRLSSEFIGLKNNWSGNFGGYSNPRADEIIAAIPVTTDPAELKALYTEAVKIYLTDVPSFALMYRPELFHAVNESVWTGFPKQGDGDNIPPTNLTDGYGIAGLYNLRLVG